MKPIPVYLLLTAGTELFSINGTHWTLEGRNWNVEFETFSHLGGLLAYRFLPHYHRIGTAAPPSCKTFH